MTVASTRLTSDGLIAIGAVLVLSQNHHKVANNNPEAGFSLSLNHQRVAHTLDTACPS